MLDEFQYLMGTREGVPSQLNAIHDVHRDDRPFVLVLCGSAVRTMEQLNAGDAPLYGRFARTIRVEPFDYFDAAALVPASTHRERAMAYGIVGGTPRYLRALRDEILPAVRGGGTLHLFVGDHGELAGKDDARERTVTGVEHEV